MAERKCTRAVQKAKRKGLSIRGIAREVGIHRDTVRKYMNAESPPVSRAHAKSAVSKSASMADYRDYTFP